MAMVPGQDSVILAENGKIIQKCLQEETLYNFKMLVPNNYIAVVESFGTKRVDVALMNTYGYILANTKYKASAKLIGTYKGKDQYMGQIVAHVDGPKTIQELNNKTFAFVDPVSTSGFILPSILLQDEKIKLKEHIFAGKHDAVISMVYQKRVDAGATYHTPSDTSSLEDARKLVLTQYPDVFTKVKILKLTPPIPSDPFVFGSHLNTEMVIKIKMALLKCAKNEAVKTALLNTYHLDGIKEADDSNWDQFRTFINKMAPIK
jgi:phosphonate transport system substrate-binding protein